MSRPKIPQTDSIQELARFWESHDLTDFEDELEEAVEPVFRQETVVNVCLPAQDAEALRRLAASQGVESSDLIREWIIERVAGSS
ncbi:MAG: CopG family antitoxin [Planctomycetaceae bacterium]